MPLEVAKAKLCGFASWVVFIPMEVAPAKYTMGKPIEVAIGK